MDGYVVGCLYCGPCYNYKDYAVMATKIAYDIQEKMHIPAIAAMSEEVYEVIQEDRDKLLIVKMPKKGGIGLNDALRNLCIVAKSIVEQQDDSQILKDYCY